MILRPRAQVLQVKALSPHPNADKLDVLRVQGTGGDMIPVITGKHYRVDQLGIYIPAGLTIPGWMAEDMWLFGRATAMKQRFEVREIELRGIKSPGLFCGAVYRKVADDPRSVERFEKLVVEGGRDVTEYLGRGRPADGQWIDWPFWRSWWKLGDDVTAYLGLTEACCR